MKVVTIGRSSDNDQVINDPLVSRHHLQIIQDNFGNYRLADFGSSNGTYVNGTRISGEVSLNPNDIVKIGNTTLPWNTYFSPAQDSASSSKDSGKKRTLIYVLVAVLVILAIIVAAVLLNKDGDSSPKENTSGQTYTSADGGHSHSNVPAVRESRSSSSSSSVSYSNVVAGNSSARVEINTSNGSVNVSASSGSGSVSTSNFAGDWVWTSGNDQFDLTLTQNGSKVTGTYSMMYGDRMVMDIDDDNYVKGDVNGNTIHAKFRSAARGGRGTAEITMLSNNRIKWKLRNTEDDCLVPNEAVLNRR